MFPGAPTIHEKSESRFLADENLISNDETQVGNFVILVDISFINATIYYDRITTLSKSIMSYGMTPVISIYPIYFAPQR